MTTDLLPHLAGVPAELAQAIDSTLRETMDHFIQDEWDDAQIDAGRFCEAALRYLEWRMTQTYTRIDGKAKPDRKRTVTAARNDTSLVPSLRTQIPQAIELVMDFRNGRNSAHLGDIDANKMDATCVVQCITWIAGEMVRLESQKTPVEVQDLTDRLSERHIPLVQTVGDQEVVLDPDLTAAQKVLVLLYRRRDAVPMLRLREWTGYTHSTKFRTNVIKALEKKRFVFVDNTGCVTLLRPGVAEAQRIMRAAA